MPRIRHTFEYYCSNPVICWNNGIMLVKDINHRFISSNYNFMKYSGLDPYKLIGLSDYDMPWQNVSNIYIQHENDIISGHEYSVLEPLNGYACATLFTSKVVIYDTKGNPAGTMATSIFCNNKVEFCNLAGESSNMKVCSYPGYNLTEKEAHILYFMLKGFTRAKVAEMAEISTSSFDFHFSNLKKKFKVDNKDGLIDICYQKRFHDVIPFRRNL